MPLARWISDSGHVLFMSSGLVSYSDSLNGVVGALQLEEHDGRLVVTSVTIKSDRVTGRLLGTVPLGRIEDVANEPDTATYVRERLGEALASEDDEALDEWEASIDDRQELAPIPVPAGPGYPDSFYLAIARAYGQCAATSNRPAIRLAEVQGVPASTVHRWVKEARRRGLMAPSGR